MLLNFSYVFDGIMVGVIYVGDTILYRYQSAFQMSLVNFMVCQFCLNNLCCRYPKKRQYTFNTVTKKAKQRRYQQKDFSLIVITSFLQNCELDWQIRHRQCCMYWDIFQTQTVIIIQILQKLFCGSYHALWLLAAVQKGSQQLCRKPWVYDSFCCNKNFQEILIYFLLF